MGPSGRWRLGIRPQLTIIVLIAAVLSTVATLFITETAIQQYVQTQATTEEQQDMNFAQLVLRTSYGENVSIGSDNTMIADSPAGTQNVANNGDPSAIGKYPLSNDTDYVDEVQHYIRGIISVYQCSDNKGNSFPSSAHPCSRISTTLPIPGKAGAIAARNVGRSLDSDVPTAGGQDIRALMCLTPPTQTATPSCQPHDWTGQVTVDGSAFFATYAPIYNPGNEVIGVLAVGLPLDAVTKLVADTTIKLVLIGTIIMVAGVILALFVTGAIVGTLQRAARQVGGASEHFAEIASQQASGSTQQVWAINAINQALQSLSETANDISRRTEQLAQMGNQVLQRRADISPTQLDSIIAYITRSVRDISVASHQQAATYERMTGAMQAVLEVAEQVAGDSQQTNENAERLETVVQQLRQLVGVRRGPLPPGTDTKLGERNPTVQAVRPSRSGKSNGLASRSEMAGRREMVGVGARATSGMSTDNNMGGPMGGALGRRGMRPGSESSMMGAPGGNSGGLGGPRSMVGGMSALGGRAMGAPMGGGMGPAWQPPQGGRAMGGPMGPGGRGTMDGPNPFLAGPMPALPGLPPLPQMGGMPAAAGVGSTTRSQLGGPTWLGPDGGRPAPMGAPMGMENGAMPGAWGAPDSGAGAPPPMPWTMPAPNSGPNSGAQGSWGMPDPTSGPEGGWRGPQASGAYDPGRSSDQ
ncbi:MAG TPA: cache domain-containing protein [Ktedonobacterales bacterium]|jgi:hypothetical protein